MDEHSVAVLRAVLDEVTDWHRVSSALKRVKGSVAMGWHGAAFDYMLVERSHEDYRARYGPIAPMMEMQDRVYPTPLDHLPPEATEAWAQAIDVIDSPLLQSRHGDLLWLTKHGSTPHLYARRALAAYEVLADGDDEHMTATHAMQRALELATELNDPTSASRLAESAVRRAEGLLNAGPERPGVALRLLEAVADLRPELRPSNLVATVELAERTYEADAWLGDSVADLLASLTPDSAARSQIRRRQVARWQRVIGTAEGLVRPIHIQHALELARDSGLADLVDQLRRELQESSARPLELHEVSGRVSIPGDELERILEEVTGDDSAIAALGRLAHQCPSGDPVRNRQTAEVIRRKSPLQFLITRLVLSEDNLPVRLIQTEDEHLEAHVSSQEVLGVRLFAAVLLVPALERLAAKYGVPDASSIAEAVSGDAIDDHLAEVLGQAIRGLLLGDDDAAAHSLVPRIERAIRQLAQKAGVVVIREPRGAVAGGVRSLGMIVADLEGVLPEEWRRYFDCLLTDPLGLNLRNRIAHGLVDRVTHEDAALLVHAAFAISQFRLSPRESA